MISLIVKRKKSTALLEMSSITGKQGESAVEMEGGNRSSFSLHAGLPDNTGVKGHNLCSVFIILRQVSGNMQENVYG